MGISEILTDLLHEKKMKQADLSRITGIPTSLISNYIKGIKSPTLTNSVKLSEALDVSVDTLAGLDAKKYSARSEAESITDEANEVAQAYDKAEPRERQIVRLTLKMPPKEGNV